MEEQERRPLATTLRHGGVRDRQQGVQLGFLDYALESGRPGPGVTRGYGSNSADDVYSRCGLRARRPPYGGHWHRIASVHVVTSQLRSDCHRLEGQLPGGI